MPDVKYVFTAEDRTAATISKIRRRIDSLAGRGAKVQVSVEADGLERTKREIEDLPARRNIVVDVTAGEESGLNAVRELPDRHGVAIDMTAGEQAGALAVRDLPDSMAVRIDAEVGSGAGIDAINDLPTIHGVVIDMEAGSEAGLLPLRGLPDSDAVSIDYELGGVAGLLPLRGLPDSDAVSIDYELGGVAGLLPLRGLPDSDAVSIDYELGGVAGLLPLRGLPDSDAVSIDYELGGVAGLLPLRGLPDSDAVSIDYELGGVAGLLPLRGLPDSDAVSIDYELGGVAGLLPLRDLPESDGITVDYELGGVAGLLPLRDLPDSDAVSIDYNLGGVAGLLPLRDMPESDGVTIDYELGGVAGLLPMRDLPESDAISIDYDLGGVAGLLPLRDLPDSDSVSIDYALGSEAGLAPLRDLPERRDVVIDATMGEQTGIAPLALLPERMSVVIDATTGEEMGINTIRGLPTRHGVVIDTALGSEAGIQAIRDLPDSHTVVIDTALGDSQGLLALQTIPETVSVTVDAVAGSTVGADEMVTPAAGGGGGPGLGDMAVGGGLMAGAVIVGGKVVDAAQALESRWMDQEQALADVSAMASSQFGGQALSEEQMASAMAEAQRISQTYDISTGQALGVMYMGMQQGRTFDQMTTGGVGETMVQTAQSTKGFGATTLETLPAVITSITDMLDVFPGTLEERLETAQRVALGWVGGGKGDITNLGIAHGLYSGVAYQQGWSPEESMGFQLSGLGGFARVGPAATGMRNVMRDILTGQGRDKWMESAATAGFVDEEGGLTFLNEEGQIKPPLEFMAELRKFNDPALQAQKSQLLYSMFTVEAAQFVDYLLRTDPEAKYNQSLAQMGMADAAVMAEIKTDTAAGQAAVLEGRREDAMSQVWQLLGGPTITAAVQAAQHEALDDIQSVFDFDQVFKALHEAATPERFAYFQERGVAFATMGGAMRGEGATPDNYQLGFPLMWRSQEKLEELNALLQGALSYEKPPGGWEAAWGLSGGGQPAAPSFGMPEEYAFSLGLSGTGAGRDGITRGGAGLGTRNPFATAEAPIEHALPGGRGLGELMAAYLSFEKSMEEFMYSQTFAAAPGAFQGMEKTREEFMYSQGFATPDEYAFSLGVSGPAAPRPPLDGVGTPYGLRVPVVGPMMPLPGGRGAGDAGLGLAAEGMAGFVSLLTGLLEPLASGGLPLDTSGLESVGIKAKVTELDTTAVEDQVIKLAADVVINVTGGAIGPRFGGVQQDDVVEQGNRVNAATTAAGRQRSGGETFDDFVASR